jgi:lysophospholipid acyltransferase (LPLAT)-like uncharacterized protein
MLKRLLGRPAVVALFASLLGRYLLFALRTTRWTVDGEEHLAPHIAGAPAVVGFWHERLPLLPMLWLMARARGMGGSAHVLISRHRDGQFIAAVVRQFGLGIVHGSTARNGRDRGGAAGLRVLLDQIEAGGHVVITPDGPRGPRRVAAPGIAHLAAVSGAPVLPCAAQTSRRRVLGSWDRMVLPLPFGRGVIVCLPPISVPRDGADQALPAIAAALTEAADRADALCL